MNFSNWRASNRPRVCIDQGNLNKLQGCRLPGATAALGLWRINVPRGTSTLGIKGKD